MSTYSWVQGKVPTVAVPFLLVFVGTVQASGGTCTLLASFRGHSASSRRSLCLRPAPLGANNTDPSKK